ncbi:alpha-2-macroglobulin family protein [Oharaeibacter diazotrophicus]|uniref:Apple domain-containing protein n=1 Tax=Oharaeibacter diazotrophicus TaxID=1920512 RepID=A0A4R6RJ74_9HYPH|nr:alpha-2-macroglobulin family protein [Oharaeibacter diazotrophicus]TDP86454.1 hypothetical protein EDD54_0329 [Oharaeibacter diazotrophicus]BBE71604.1 hypothetical protein OHA_1_01182 [Pleomorphomonas sp. SM30]GLS78366.1 membrane protein [Oharaeibacter diazotrophicus]
MSVSGSFSRVARAVFAASVFLGASFAPALAAERRAIVTPDSDYFGRDLETLKNVDVDACEKACVADEACKAFTYNTKARWCFKKAEVGDMRSFAGAISGRIVETAAVDPNLADTRRAELNYLTGSYIDEARAFLGQLDKIEVPDDIAAVIQQAMDASMAGDPLTANDRYKTALAMDRDRYDLWEAFTAATLAVQSDDWEVKDRVQTEATAGAVNAYLHAAEPEQRGFSLQLLAKSLAARENWRLAIKTGRRALDANADKDFAGILEGWIEEHGFRVADNTVDTSSADPRICVVFSDPIAKDDANIADYVKVEGGDTLAVEAEDSQICVSGVAYGQRYHLSVRQGLPAADIEETLRRTVDLDVYVRDRDPLVRFVGRAYVLPKIDGATIPVVSVNVDTIEATVVRISDRSLVPAVGNGDFLSQLSSWQVDEMIASKGEKVWQGTVKVARDTNRDVTTAIPVGEVVGALKPGVYAMTAQAENTKDEWGSQATQWFVVTEMGLTSLTGNDGLHVVVRSLTSAGPVAGAKLTLLALNNDVLATATTDDQGYARFDAGLARGTGGAAPAMVAAVGPAGDFTFLDLAKTAFDLSDRGVDGRASPLPVDVWMATDRGVYRPGETVNLTALARDGKVDASPDVPLTMVVTRPDGVEHLRRVVADEGAGGRDFAIDLPGTAMRGAWTVAAYVDPKGDAVSTKTFQVEDFQPERIDFAVKTDAKVLKPGETVSASLDANWLYGAPAGNLAVEGEVYVTKADGIPTAPGYSFGLVDDEFTPVAEPVAGGPTGEDGHADIDLVTPNVGDTTLPLKAAVHVRVLDTNGRPVERRMTLPVSDGRARIGVDPQFDGHVEEGGNARFNVAVVDGEGIRSAAKGLKWTLDRIETRYQWYNSDGSWNYEPITATTRVANGTLDVGADEPAKLEARVTWGSYRLSVEDPAGATVPVTYSFEAGWYVAAGADETPDFLKISLDKQKYAVGDTLTAHLEPRFPGIALIQVVDDRLITMKTVEVAEGGADVALPVTADWGPGAYVTATLLRPMDVAAKRMPARALGLAWAAVDPGSRLLGVTVGAPDEMRPRGPLPIEVAVAGAAAGEDAYVTVAAIDVGILNLTGYKAPAPEDWYFAQRQLGIQFRDVYGQLIDTTLGARGEVRSGGDGGGISKLLGPPPTERLVAFFQGATKVDADGKLRVSFDMPDFNGTVKVMAVAWTKSAVGHGTKDVVVRDPVVVTASLPAFLAPGDRSRLRLDLTHVQGPAGAFKLTVSAAGSLVDVDEKLGNRLVEIAEKGTAEVLVPLKAIAVGDETITVGLEGPDGTTATKTLTMPVRANEPPVVRVSDFRLAAKDGKLSVGADLVADYLPGTASATVTVGHVAGIDLPGLVASLDKYPYGCTEQITSRALPLVYLDDVVLAAGLTGETPVRERVQQAVADVLVNQASNGSFGLWSPGSEDLWLDAYVTDFLTRAKEKGYAVPEVGFDLAVTNLKNRIAYSTDFTTGGEDVAYALYVLARNGRASIGDLRYFAETKLDAFVTPLAKAQLGAALALYGDNAKADAVFRAALGLLTDRPDRDKLWRIDYGSDLRDGAAILALASENRVKSVDQDQLGREIQKLADGSRWLSTQEQAWMLLAANALINGGAKPTMEVDGVRREGVFTGRYAPEALAKGVSVANLGDHALDARVTVTGVPTTPEPAGGDGYAIERTYYDLEGNVVDPAAVKLGDRLVVTLRVTTTETAQARLMVDDPLPAGFAIDNPSLVSAGDVSMLSSLPLATTAAATEYRSDRFVAAYDRSGGESEFAFAYMVRAIAPGTFQRPAAVVLDMYRPEKRARTESGAIEIVGPLQ